MASLELLGEEAFLVPYLVPRELLALARSCASEWRRALESVRDSYGAGAVGTQAPFAMTFEYQKSAAFRFLPLWQESLFFENFHDNCSRWLNFTSSGAFRRWCPRKAEDRPFEPLVPGVANAPQTFGGGLRAGGIFSVFCELGAIPVDIFSIYFTYDSSGRTMFAGDGRSADVALGRWEDEQWYEFLLHFDWATRKVRVRHALDGRLQRSSQGCCVDLSPDITRLQAAPPPLVGIKLWHAAEDFEASWTDVLVI
ncbi:unnamed protein product [Cladocopium goreaui]|uniref:Uncharacterized protein n=1 Tax=Cladocopium goreaui TaxID=2562237 RepID=A0A9P1DGD6_9DINO|nr:unnamed protein product [Cladocopium goreaui]